MVIAIGTTTALLIIHTVSFAPSDAMAPTIQIGDRHLLDRISFRVTGLHHGDIVAIAVPNDPEGVAPGTWTHTKRVIGLPGDTIDCRDGRVFRNGAPLHEPYLPTDPKAAWADCASRTVPDGELYLLGDHRVSSQDSRDHGMYRQDDVKGRLLWRVWRWDT